DSRRTFSPRSGNNRGSPGRVLTSPRILLGMAHTGFALGASYSHRDLPDNQSRQTSPPCDDDRGRRTAGRVLLVSFELTAAGAASCAGDPTTVRTRQPDPVWRGPGRCDGAVDRPDHASQLGCISPIHPGNIRNRNKSGP